MIHVSKVVLVLLLASSCRISKVGKDSSGSNEGASSSDAADAKAPVVQPQKQSTPGVTINVTLDDSGKIIDKLALRLDYFPAPRPDGVSIPTCYNELASHLIVGRMACASNGNIAMDVSAGQVYQRCTISNPAKLIEPKSTLVLAGCRGAAVMQAAHYEPDVKMEVMK
jgi:hypothetical protein